MRKIALLFATAALALGVAIFPGGSPTSAQEPLEIEGLVGNVDDGAKVFKKCATCHVLEEGKNRIGPSLFGVIGRTAGTVEGFSYSKANKESGVVWTPEILFVYLESPKAFVPGAKITFVGLPKPQDRVDVIASLLANGGRAPQ